MPLFESVSCQRVKAVHLVAAGVATAVVADRSTIYGYNESIHVKNNQVWLEETTKYYPV